MKLREAKIEDVKQIQIVRNSVKKNMLSDPNLVTDEDCETFINVRGKGVSISKASFICVV